MSQEILSALRSSEMLCEPALFISINDVGVEWALEFLQRPDMSMFGGHLGRKIL